MARTLVIITLIIWLLIFLVTGALVGHALFALQIALLPLYALYPGQDTSGGPDYHPFQMHAWAVAAGIVFIVLGVLGAWRKSKPAAIAFMLLFITSVIVFLARASADLRDLH
jgi:hypothetical protein